MICWGLGLGFPVPLPPRKKKTKNVLGFSRLPKGKDSEFKSLQAIVSSGTRLQRRRAVKAPEPRAPSLFSEDRTLSSVMQDRRRHVCLGFMVQSNMVRWSPRYQRCMDDARVEE